jgi:hypothetical protein
MQRGGPRTRGRPTGLQRGGPRTRGWPTRLHRGGPRTRGGPTGLHRGGPVTMSGGRGQVQGTIHTVRLYGPSQSKLSQSNASVSKLFIILFHYSAFKLMCILLLDRS